MRNQGSHTNQFYVVWSSYRDVVFRNTSAPPGEDDALQYWRDHLFAATVFYLMPLSLIALIPGIYAAYAEGLTYLIVADGFAVISLLVIAFVPGIPVYTRKLIFCAALYLVSLALLFYLGTFGPGLMYLLAVGVFVILIFEKRYGFIVVLLNTLICTIFGFAIYYGWWDTLVLSVYDLQSWIAVSSNLVFLNLLAVLLIPKLYNGLNKTIQEENRLRVELEQNQQKLNRSLEELEQKNGELEQFAYAASHDLKEPLRMVQSFMKLLSDKYGDSIDAEGKKYIHFAIDGSDRMKVLIDDLLEFSRVGRENSTFEKTDLNRVLDDVMALIRSFVDEHQATVTWAKMPEIVCQKVPLKQLFSNLITNSIKYRKESEPPVVEISCEEKPGEWLFAVSDNGKGIDPKYHTVVFDLFKRIDVSDRSEGTGMGLAICKKIVEQHGGKIWVESEAGKGSTFGFTIAK